jgi:hypothetical protein
MDSIKHDIKTLDEFADLYIEDTPEEFQTRDDYINLLEQRIDTVIDFADSQGYAFDEDNETFTKRDQLAKVLERK